MKTWEMIKAIAEDNDKVFKNNLGSKVGLINGVLSWINMGDEVQEPLQLGNTINWNNLDIDWTEVQKRYTFEEAYKICKETGQKFRGVNSKVTDSAENQIMDRFLKDVYITDKEKESIIILDCMWVKVE